MTHARRLWHAAPVLVVVSAYSIAWALFLTSDLIAVVGVITVLWPLYLVVFVLVQIELGYWLDDPMAVWICLIPLALAVPLAPWMPVDPDIPAFPTLVAYVLVFPVTPAASLLTGMGVWLRYARRAAA